MGLEHRTLERQAETGGLLCALGGYHTALLVLHPRMARAAGRSPDPAGSGSRWRHRLPGQPGGLSQRA